MDTLLEDAMILFLYKRNKKKKEKNIAQKEQQHTRYQKEYYNSLCARERQRRDRRIPRVSLQPASDSAWKTLYNSANDQAMITLTGLDYCTFHWLADKFCPLFETYTPHTTTGEITQRNTNRGRKRMMGGIDCLGLYLAWSRLRGTTMCLSMLFGMTATSVSMYIRFARRIVVLLLHDDEMAKLQIPTDDRIREYMDAVAAKHPRLQGVWCTMDGLKLYLQQSPKTVIQNRFYNGWTHDHYVTNVLCFCPDGTIPIAAYNCPGSFHDSTVADWGNIYTKLAEVHQRTGGKCTVDSAFSRGRYPFLIKSSQSDPENPEDFCVNTEATSMRQSAEWGMRAFQSSFPRLKDRLLYEEKGERRLILKSLILLYNVRARKVGINQIRNTYMKDLERNANVEYVNRLV